MIRRVEQGFHLLLYNIIILKSHTKYFADTSPRISFFSVPQKVQNTPSNASSTFPATLEMCRSSKKHKSLVAARCAYEHHSPTSFFWLSRKGGTSFWVAFF